MLLFGDNYVFLHIPKNSGKYIRKQIRNQFEVEDIESGPVPISRYGVHVNWHPTYKKLVDIHYKKFITFSRNPYDRLISTYFYLHMTDPKTIDDFKNFVKFELINFKFENIEIDFENLNFDFFFQQYKFILDNDENIPSNLTIYKLEEPQDFIKFEDFNLKRYNYQDYYDDEMIQIVNSIYQKDFELLGYQIL